MHTLTTVPLPHCSGKIIEQTWLTAQGLDTLQAAEVAPTRATARTGNRHFGQLSALVRAHTKVHCKPDLRWETLRVLNRPRVGADGRPARARTRIRTSTRLGMGGKVIFTSPCLLCIENQ